MSNPDCTLEPVEPAEPVAPWFGGKRNLAKRISARIESIPHRCYAEPFVGMGGVFFRRRHRPKSEIINDISGHIVTLLRVMREHPGELVRQFEWVLSSRSEYRRLLVSPDDVLTDIQRAARFVYLQQLSFGGKPPSHWTPGNFAPSVYNASRLSADRLQQLIARAHKRLQRVHVECLEWDAFMRRYDRPFTLFYIDPPYWGHEADYGKGLFAREDFAAMAEILRGLRGRFILSINDRPEVRETFAGFEMEEVTLRYTANAKAMKQAAELLISGGGGPRPKASLDGQPLPPVETVLPVARRQHDSLNRRPDRD